MSLDISKDIEKVKSVLLSQENKNDILNHMNENQYDEQTPIKTSFLNSNRDKTIILTEEIKEFLDEINNITQEIGQEVPYFLTGSKLEDGNIIFDSIIVSGERHSQQAIFDKTSVQKLNVFVNNNISNKNAIVCHGHTHPKKGEHYNDFSITDLAAYVNFKENPQFGAVDTIGMVLVDGSYNFVQYENNEFSKLNNVVKEIEPNSKYEKVPSYSHEKEVVEISQNHQVKSIYDTLDKNYWDNSFNDIAQNSNNDKKYIREQLILEADNLNKSLYEAKQNGKITEEQMEEITSRFNESFNQAFDDFELELLSQDDLVKTTQSMNELINNKKQSEIDIQPNVEENSMIRYEKKSTFMKFVDKIKKVFNKRNEKQNPKPAINEFGEIIRNRNSSAEFSQILQQMVKNDIPVFQPPENKDDRNISIDDFINR